MDWGIVRKDKRKILYLKRMSGVPTVIFRKTISNRVEKAGLKGKPFPFDAKRPAYRVKNIFYYFVDVDLGQQYLYDEQEKIAPELLDSVITRQIAKQLVAGLETPPLFQNLMLTILCIGFGVAIGYILGLALPIG